MINIFMFIIKIQKKNINADKIINSVTKNDIVLKIKIVLLSDK